jgi:hypothetical protein
MRLNKRHILDIQKLVDDKIIFITVPGDGQGGITKPNWEGDCSVLTLLNLTPEELKLNPWRKKAMKYKLPQCIPHVQKEQSSWSNIKYKQVLDSIKEAGKDIEDYVIKDNNLQETIRKVLKEETEKDLSRLMEELLNNALVRHHENICKIKVTAPWNIESPDNKKYGNYAVTTYFISGPNTKFWPRTQATRQNETEIMDEALNLIYDWFGKSVFLHYRHVNECE